MKVRYRNDWDLYEYVMKLINPENVELAGIYAISLDGLIENFKQYAKDNEMEALLEDIENDALDEIEFTGKGYYDLWAYGFTAGRIVSIEEILRQEVAEVVENSDLEIVIPNDNDRKLIKKIYRDTRKNEWILRRCDGEILRITHNDSTAYRWIRNGGVSLTVPPYDNEGKQYVEKNGKFYKYVNDVE